VSHGVHIRVALPLLTVMGLASLAWAAFAKPIPRVVYNASDSVPVGWYSIGPANALHVGSFVLVRLPATPRALAARRGYLPWHIPLLKRIGAMAPQIVCIRNGIVRIDAVRVAVTLPADRSGRRLTAWRQCRRIRAGELFLLSTTNPASFDSRYFGPVLTSEVIGQAQPIYTRPRR
jgi:conjugative transfer signal peptidase TraF